ncbi:ribonuclease Z [Balneola vulgaris]|uniref:ribonuclease Z n=1 Tax=Balneola vulgaris TaxID=287535 RepID=UPI00035D765B|nr:ribonuclease Z [Balneola vulgaris]
MIVVPLGVASATPTAVRHLPAVALWREGSVFLFDCGENAQMRMLQAGIKRSKIECIFISHFDVDHYSGLIGLLSTLQLQRRDKPLRMVGPKGLQEYIEWNLKFSDIEIGFEIIFIEVEHDTDAAVVIDEEDYIVEARALKHRRFCLGYRFQEKDKPGKVNAELANELGVTKDEDFKALKNGEDITLDDGTEVKSVDIVGHPRPGDSFAYVTDTEYCPNAVKLALNTNILYHEATFSDSLADKASETGHSSAKDAARVATEAQTKLLVIGHFSARYTNPHVLLKEARDGFYPAWLANELRPIYTDPSHERGILTAKVELRDLTKSNDSRGGGGRSGGHRGRSGGGGGYRSNDRGGGNRNFRPRRSSGGGGGYRSNDRRSSGGGGGGYRSRDNNRSDGGGYNSRSNDGGGYRSRNRNHRDSSSSGRSSDNKWNSDSNRSYSSRSSYDDQDRF